MCSPRAAAAGVSLSELLRQAIARKVERERTRQIARWAHTHVDDLAAVEVIANTW